MMKKRAFFTKLDDEPGDIVNDGIVLLFERTFNTIVILNSQFKFILIRLLPDISVYK